jgi:hypothetical protein
MKKTLALFALAACFCLSGNSAPPGKDHSTILKEDISYQTISAPYLNLTVVNVEALEVSVINNNNAVTVYADAAANLVKGEISTNLFAYLDDRVIRQERLAINNLLLTDHRNYALAKRDHPPSLNIERLWLERIRQCIHTRSGVTNFSS